MLEALWLLWASLFSAVERVERRLNYVPEINDATDYTHLIKQVPDTFSMSTLSQILAKKNVTHIPKDVIQAMFNNGEMSRRNNKKETNGDIEKSYEWLRAEPRPLKDLFDVVVLTGTLTATTKESALIDYSDWLSFFESWKPVLEHINVIIMQQGDPSIHIELPSWLEFELYTRLDVQKTLGDLAWIIDMNVSDSSSARSFAFMASDKDYIFVLDRFMLPVVDSSTGKIVNVLEGHLQQLLTPSDPYYFNSFHDPYQKNNDFIRGYPYLLRGGALTGLSQGQAMKPFDFDAATQLIKPSSSLKDENSQPSLRNGNHYHHNNTVTPNGVDSQTVPHGVMFSLTNNFAFFRVATAPIMYFPPAQLAREWGYDIGEKNLNILTGWIVKTVLDYVRLGVKYGGDTYMTRTHHQYDDNVNHNKSRKDLIPSHHNDYMNHTSSHQPLTPSRQDLVDDLMFDYTWINCPNASLDRLHKWLTHMSPPPKYLESITAL